MELNQLIATAVFMKASDLHLSAGEAPMVRIDGDMRRLDLPVVSDEELGAMLMPLLTQEQRDVLQELNDCDLSLQRESGVRVRLNVFHHVRGLGCSVRIIPRAIPTIESLGLPSVLREVARAPHGLVLVTGPTGSGKSSTLAAMIDLINRESRKHIVTIEDPIEFIHEPHRSLVTQREVGAHAHSFARALRAALREDPDCILIGELRDYESIQLALTAAETGHIVFATLHTTSAAQSVDRIVDVFPAAQQAQVRSMFADSMRAVISQRLLRRTDAGRVAAAEILVATPAVRNLIREGKTHQLTTVMQTSREQGMQTFEMHVRELRAKGVLTEYI